MKEEDNNVEGCWERVKMAYSATAKKVLGTEREKVKFGSV